jgi:hypothetical protein
MNIDMNELHPMPPFIHSESAVKEVSALQVKVTYAKELKIENDVPAMMKRIKAIAIQDNQTEA